MCKAMTNKQVVHLANNICLLRSFEPALNCRSYLTMRICVNTHARDTFKIVGYDYFEHGTNLRKQPSIKMEQKKIMCELGNVAMKAVV